VLHRGLVNGDGEHKPGTRGVALLQDISAQRRCACRNSRPMTR
jgi:hypothetical protein